MMHVPPANFLDQALGGSHGSRVILIEDCVETSGTFVLHHLLKRCLSSLTSDIVIFLSFAQPFSHYDRILRKMGCNLVVQKDNRHFLFLDLLKLENQEMRGGRTVEDKLLALYGEVQKAVEVYSSPEGSRNITIMIDDVSLMEVAANGSSGIVLDFLHYCYSLTTQFGCSLVVLNHEDIYSSMDRPVLLLEMQYLADIVIKVEPLATGLATDVHGQLTILNRGLHHGNRNSRDAKIHNFQFRIKESTSEYFYPGSCN